jgi:hypothetical protein
MLPASCRCCVQSLPLEMVLSHALTDAGVDFMWLPAEPEGLPEPDLVK